MNVRILPLLSTQLNIFLAQWSADIQRQPVKHAMHKPPTLGQAGVRARAELQLLTRALVVVLSESYMF